MHLNLFFIAFLVSSSSVSPFGGSQDYESETTTELSFGYDAGELEFETTTESVSEDLEKLDLPPEENVTCSLNDLRQF